MERDLGMALDKATGVVKRKNVVEARRMLIAHQVREKLERALTKTRLAMDKPLKTRIRMNVNYRRGDKNQEKLLKGLMIMLNRKHGAEEAAERNGGAQENGPGDKLKVMPNRMKPNQMGL